MGPFICLLFLLAVSSVATASDHCVHTGKASFFADPGNSIPNGACGYGWWAMTPTDGSVGSAIADVYRQGAGCGACYHVRCLDMNYCSKEGTQVMVTDNLGTSDTAFVFHPKVFDDMAMPGMGNTLNKEGIVDIEYYRVPCVYKNQNLNVRVEEASNWPYYLALKVMYQGGQTDILGVDMAQVGSSDWTSMSRSYGAVWDTNKVPRGDLQIRFKVMDGNKQKYEVGRNVIPGFWKAKDVYDCGFQITEVAQESASHCSSMVPPGY